MQKLVILIVFLGVLFRLHAQSKDRLLFSLLNEKQTGISFTNTITEDDSLNVFRYEYLYNGAGVGVGDFNNDGLQDIFFASNTSSNKFYLNKGAFSFADVTKQAGLTGNGTWSTGVCVADVNGDGLLDIYVCHSGKYADSNQLCNELYINTGLQNGVPGFKNMAKQYGLDAPGTQSTQAVFFDYDKDGDLDMFLLNHSNHTYNPFLNTKKTRATPDFHFGNRLFRNDRDAKGQMHFTDVTLQAGIINNALNFGLSVTVSDVNKDGWPDIYTTSDYTERDCFYVNNHNGTFTESLEKSFAHISKYAMGADIADYNNDGRPDVFTLDMLPEDNHRQKLLKGADEYDQYHLLLDSGYYHQQMRNMLQLNEGADENGNTRFSEIGQLAGVSNTDWSWSALLTDFDNDGWKDIFISNGYLRDYTDLDFLKYTVADAKVAAFKEGNLNFQTLDLVKQMPSNKMSNYIFQNNKYLSFSNRTKDWGLDKLAVSNAAAYADLDNDGDMDLIVCNNNEPALIYRNNSNEQTGNHFIKFYLEGDNFNTKALGAKVLVTTPDSVQQYEEAYTVRGYESSVSADLIFGLGKNKTAGEIRVIWTDGKQTILTNIHADTTLFIKQKEAIEVDSSHIKPKHLFTDITAKSGLHFTHKENDFTDFKAEVLLPYELSKLGPALAKADVNGDGLEDVFIGGAIDQPGVLYLQNKDNTCGISSSQPWAADSVSEEVSAIFFDADNDGDNDLYVVSGGNEYDDGSPEYEDNLYINNGKGIFAKANAALPQMLSSKLAITAADFDNDGDMDLFVGGRGLPGSFPLPSNSYLLRNDSQNGTIRFTDVTDEVCPSLRKAGMITAASFIDLNGDHFPELIIAGDWMPVMIFQNIKGSFQNVSDKAGLQNMNGMWASITAADVDGDGDTDFVLGNCGYNNQFSAAKDKPMTMYAADFDDNGTIDPVVCYYIQGKSYPMASRDELLEEVVSLKKKFIHYKDYADATISDMFPKNKIDNADLFTCNQLASGILYNDGNMKFHFEAMPLQAQFSRVSSAIINDFDGDGKTDILLAGNFYPYRVQLGKCDASLGLLLKGNSNKNFTPVDPSTDNCYISGDVRNMIVVKDAQGENIIVVAKNDDAVQVIKSGK